MAKPDTSRIDTLEAIMAEKRKHESYLAKLEERRASTPAHVFNRLRDEYLTKLTDLQVRASMEAESLGETLKADEIAVAEIEAKLALVTEERIEGELRAEVGEYDPKDWAKKLDALNASIAQIEKERATKVAAFERTRSLLTEARGAATPVEAPAPAPVPSLPVPPSPAPAPEPIAAPRASAPTPAKPPEVAAPPAAVAPPPPVRQTPLGQVAPTMQPAPEAPAAPPATAAPPAQAPAAAAPVAPSPESPAPKAPAAPQGAPMAGSPSFDELAFLNSVVGRTSTPMKVDEAAGETASRASGSGRAVPPPAPQPAPPVAPPARGTTSRSVLEGDSGPLGRPTPRTSQAIKTLKCQECGTLNYPTEWYCERCGGELAAL